MCSGCGKAWCFGFLLVIMAPMVCAGQSQKSEERSEANEQIYDLGPDIVAPRVIKQVNPKYSDSSHGVRVVGSVTLKLIVTSQGLPKDPHVIRGIDDEVDRAAVEALNQWRFSPARKNGQAVAVRVVVEIQFHSM